jgi:capsular polysaccharide biosynthesis protein
VDRALVPTRPIPPSINMITLLAGMIGIILGLFIIYIIEIFDDTFSSQESIEDELGLTVIAIIPKFKGEEKNGIE